MSERVLMGSAAAEVMVWTTVLVVLGSQFELTGPMSVVALVAVALLGRSVWVLVGRLSAEDGDA